MGKVSGVSCRRGESGQGLTEYLIILALIVIAAIGVYGFFGQGAGHQPPARAPAPAKTAVQAAPAPAPAPVSPQTSPAQPEPARETGDSHAAGSRAGGP